ncbi:hypothetical protein B7494_g2200 [Chlorociboria aeruginascens]|nr:hypothetical protein B7494_g2200 [Chlorociboria aeruginascens]
MRPQELEVAGGTTNLKDQSQTGFINISFSPQHQPEEESRQEAENQENSLETVHSQLYSNTRDSPMCSTGHSQTSKTPEGVRVMEDLPIPIPIIASYPEVIIYRKDNGELTSAVTLTKDMVGHWNMIFRSEERIYKYKVRIRLIAIDEDQLDTDLQEMNESLRPPSTSSQQMVLEERKEQIRYQIDQVWKDRTKFQKEREMWERRLKHEEGELSFSKGHLYQAWESLLEENNLIEKDIEDDLSLNSETISNTQYHDSASIEAASPTPSQVAQNARDLEIEMALDDMHTKARLVREAQDKINNWQFYYENEYHAYCRCVEEGRMEPARTEFDLTLLTEAREAQKELGIAEKEYGEARQHIKSLGVLLDDIDQESDFENYQDDGYRESMEADIIGRVDRTFIEKWMDEEEDRPGHSIECDDWEAKTIDLCDSISVVAEGKERKRIDRWRSMCEIITDDVTK